MKKIRYNDTFIYVDDSELDDSETGKLNNTKENDEYENDDSISNEDLLENTITDLWGNSNE